MAALSSVAASRHRSVMSLYSDPSDPASHAVRLVFGEKAVHVHVEHVAPGTRPADLDALNPYPSVLTLVDRDLVLYQAQIILEYLDERYPHPPLLPVSPLARANNRLYRSRIYTGLYLPLDVLAGDVPRARRDEARVDLARSLESLNAIFSRTLYLMSDEFSLVECYLAPVLWRLPSVGVDLGPSLRHLARAARRLFERPAFDASLTPAERAMGGQLFPAVSSTAR